MRDLGNLTREEFDALSVDEAKEIGIKYGKEILIPFIGMPKKGKMTFEQLQLLSDWLHDKFVYTSDMERWGVQEKWETSTYLRILLQTTLNDDCDAMSNAVSGVLHYIFGLPKDNLWQASCRTETGEGHLVSWTRATNGVIYQLENRKRQVYTLKYYRDLGYEYWDYSSFLKPMEWDKAQEFVALEIYNTPNNLKSDKPNFRVSKAFRVDKSKTLLKNWSGIAIGGFVSVSNSIQDNPQGSLILLGVIMVALGLLGVYLRTITNKDIDIKRGY